MKKPVAILLAIASMMIGQLRALDAATSPSLIELEKITAFDGASEDQFGQSVAIGGDTAVAGAPRHLVGSNTRQGSVYIRERNMGGVNKWGAVKTLVASDGRRTASSPTLWRRTCLSRQVRIR